MAGRRPQLRTILPLILIAAVFATTTLVWLYVDRTPPNWDDAWYLTNSLTVYDALTHDGVVGYLTKVNRHSRSGHP
jgi:hypothetical protein